MKEKYYYKVLYKYNTKKLTSFNTGRTLEKDSTLIYPKNKWIKPEIEGTKLFVCDTLDNALDMLNYFTCSYDNFKVFKCEVKNPRRKSRMLSLDFSTNKTNILKRFFTKISSIKMFNKKNTPKGTYICDKLKLIKAIKI